MVVRPTLAAALRWAQDAQRRSNGVVNATMLAQRWPPSRARAGPVAEARAWTIVPKRRSAVVKRTCEFSFDLDGVAKGWIADRAADLLLGWPGVAVNADGDIAFQIGRGVEWLVAITDPGDHGEPIATLSCRAVAVGRVQFGVATSGTTIHRWQLADGRVSHHLIDRRTGRPAQTDVVQATVVAPSAREAEMFAKSAVILGGRGCISVPVRVRSTCRDPLLDDGDVSLCPGRRSGWHEVRRPFCPYSLAALGVVPRGNRHRGGRDRARSHGGGRRLAHYTQQQPGLVLEPSPRLHGLRRFGRLGHLRPVAVDRNHSIASPIAPCP